MRRRPRAVWSDCILLDRDRACQELTAAGRCSAGAIAAVSAAAQPICPSTSARTNFRSRLNRGRRRVHCRYHRAGETAERAIDQEVSRDSRACRGDRRDRSGWPRALFHDHANADGDAATWRLGATMPRPACEIAPHVIDAFVAKDYERAAEMQLQCALFPSKWMQGGLAPA